MKAKETKDLHLILKHKWYDMIASGEKKVEYRELKDYYRRKFYNKRYTHVVFHRGYTNETIKFQIEGIGVGEGKPEWGAEPNVNYFKIVLGKKDMNTEMQTKSKLFEIGEKIYTHCFEGGEPIVIEDEVSEIIEMSHGERIYNTISVSGLSENKIYRTELEAYLSLKDELRNIIAFYADNLIKVKNKIKELQKESYAN